MLPWLLPKINHFWAGTDSQASPAASGTIHPMPAHLRLNSGADLCQNQLRLWLARAEILGFPFSYLL
jgi:hypothetical protein